MPEIPGEVANIEEEGNIPKNVAELPQNIGVPELKPYIISFAKYNEDLCEIDSLSSNKARKAISLLKKVGTEVFCRDDFFANDIKTDLIDFRGEYKKLYNRIDQGIEIREMFLQGDGRIFFFDIEPERALYVVAITENHFETKQVRR